MLRFAGALHLVGGHIVIEAELDTGSVARRLRKEIAEVFGHGSEVQIVAGGGLRKGSRYLVRVTKRRRGAGPAVRPGRPARPAGQAACRTTSWPAASATPRRPGAARSSRTARSPSRAGPARWRSPARRTEAALALVGVGRRLGVAAKAREVRGADRVVVRDGDAIGALLTRHRRARVGAGLGGAADAPRGAGHRQPAGQLRRRQPAPLGPGRGRRRRPGASGRWRSSATTPRSTCCRPAGCGWSTSRPRWRSWARCPTRR